MLGPGGEVLWLVRCWTITASIHPQICLRNQSVGTVGKSVDTVGKSVDTVGKSINGLSWKISGHSGHSWKINQWTQLENQSTQLENQSVDAAGKSISGHSWKINQWTQLENAEKFEDRSNRIPLQIVLEENRNYFCNSGIYSAWHIQTLFC